MPAHPSFFTQKILQAFVGGLLVCGLFSCAGKYVVNHYPKNTPFVYDHEIKVEGNISKTQQADLKSALEGQLDDSIGVEPRRKAFSHWRLNAQVLDSVPIYRRENADKSVMFMQAQLNSLGYFNDTITYDTTVVLRKTDQLRTTVTFNVKVGKQVTLDSIWYSIRKPELQAIVDANMSDALVKKGDPFAQGPISSELDRITELYRNNGYIRFNRDEMVVVWDTVDADLLHPAIDPFEQLEILQQLAARRAKPTANLEFRLQPDADSAKLVRYYIGDIFIFPDNRPDTIGKERKVTNVAPNLYVIQHSKKFKPHIFPINIYMKHGQPYSQRRYQRTLNRLNSIGAWKVVNATPRFRLGQDTVDFKIELTPSKKYLFNANTEVSQNQTALSGNLLGLGVNVGIQDRNFAHAANLNTVNFRYGIEFGSKFIQTQQVGLGYNIFFPRPIPAFRWLPDRLRDNVQTILSFNADNTERRSLYNLTRVNASWGYEFSQNIPRKNRSIQVSVKLPNIEYSYLRERDSLLRLIAANPALRNIFTDGFIASVQGGWSVSNNRAKSPNVLTLNTELPIPLSFVRSKFLDSQLYSFVKFSAEFTQLFKFRKTSLALHAFGGVGWEFNSTRNERKRSHLPFFKQFYAGGPNSMRAWRLRRLGPGSSIMDFADNPERYGDMQLEVNAEYRFPLANVGGVKIESVLFTDIGNVWLLKKSAGPPEQVFNIGRLGKDLAVGVGTGLRLDFSFFLIRVDYAYKMKDPSPDPTHADGQNKLFYNWKPFGGQLQIGINYPFKL